ncbi:MAG: hypothetical protein ACHQRL_07745, partial [Gemmatimonadales bacterium]
CEAEPAELGAGDLDTVLDKALRKEPAERYQTVAAFADDLGRYLRHEPVSARRPTLAYRARKFVRRNRAGVTAAMIVAAALIGATIFSVGQMREARRQRDAAVAANKRSTMQSDFQALLISQVGDKPMTMREILERGRATLEHEYAGDPRFLSTTFIEMAESYSQLGDSKIRGTLLARAESLSVAGGYTEQLPEIRCSTADNMRTNGDYDLASRTFADADSMLRARPQPEVESVCLGYEADLASELGDGARSARLTSRAIAIRDSLGDVKDMTYDGLLSSLAYSLDRQGRFRDAIGVYHRAAAIMDSGGRGGTMSRAILQHDLALTLVEVGETAQAEPLLHDVLLRVAQSDPDARMPPQALIHYSHTALFDGRPDSASKYFAVLADQAKQDTNIYWEGRGLFGLVQAQVQSGHIDDARRSLIRFRAIAGNPKLANSDDQVVDVRVLDAWMALAAGDTSTAYDRVVDALRSHGYFAGERKPIFRAALILAAETALAVHRNTDALTFARDALSISTRDSLTEKHSAYVGEAKLMESRALLASGDTASARAALDRAVVALRNGAGADHPRTREAEALRDSLLR